MAITLLVDSSVFLEWCQPGIADAPALALWEASASPKVDARIIELGLYEAGNVLLRSRHWPAGKIIDQLRDFQTIFGPPLRLSGGSLELAAQLGDTHHLTFYDALWAATARCYEIPLVSLDKQLLRAGLAESPLAFTRRLPA